MSDLERIEREAKERRKSLHHTAPRLNDEDWCQMMYEHRRDEAAAVDELLAIARELGKDVEDARRGEREAEEAEAKALVAARELRAALANTSNVYTKFGGPEQKQKVLADTAWVEEV